MYDPSKQTTGERPEPEPGDRGELPPDFSRIKRRLRWIALGGLVGMAHVYAGLLSGQGHLPTLAGWVLGLDALLATAALLLSLAPRQALGRGRRD
jgi:fermentation-respiration switch protein FrsA (DUF1100 family)